MGGAGEIRGTCAEGRRERETVIRIRGKRLSSAEKF
jgi:hypothetical protein